MPLQPSPSPGDCNPTTSHTHPSEYSYVNNCIISSFTEMFNNNDKENKQAKCCACHDFIPLSSVDSVCSDLFTRIWILFKLPDCMPYNLPLHASLSRWASVCCWLTECLFLITELKWSCWLTTTLRKYWYNFKCIMLYIYFCLFKYAFFFYFSSANATSIGPMKARKFHQEFQLNV